MNKFMRILSYVVIFSMLFSFLGCKDKDENSTDGATVIETTDKIEFLTQEKFKSVLEKYKFIVYNSMHTLDSTQEHGIKIYLQSGLIIRDGEMMFETPADFEPQDKDIIVRNEYKLYESEENAKYGIETIKSRYINEDIFDIYKGNNFDIVTTTKDGALGFFLRVDNVNVSIYMLESPETIDFFNKIISDFGYGEYIN